MSDERLLPCPFCGGEAEVITTKTRQGQTSSVRCSKCSCKVTILKPAFYDGDVEKDTVEHWNTRKPMERIVEKLEEAKGIAFLTLANTGEAMGDVVYDEVMAYLDKAVKIVKGGGADE